MAPRKTNCNSNTFFLLLYVFYYTFIDHYLYLKKWSTMYQNSCFRKFPFFHTIKKTATKKPICIEFFYFHQPVETSCWNFGSCIYFLFKNELIKLFKHSILITFKIFPINWYLWITIQLNTVQMTHGT